MCDFLWLCEQAGIAFAWVWSVPSCAGQLRRSQLFCYQYYMGHMGFSRVCVLIECDGNQTYSARSPRLESFPPVIGLPMDGGCLLSSAADRGDRPAARVDGNQMGLRIVECFGWPLPGWFVLVIPVFVWWHDLIISTGRLSRFQLYPQDRSLPVGWLWIGSDGLVIWPLSGNSSVLGDWRVLFCVVF